MSFRGGGGVGGGSGRSHGVSGGYGRENSEGQDNLGARKRDGSGLNPNRVRGFGMQQGSARLETPSVNDLRAKQGAIVSKFMTFLQRKNSLVVELYESAFYQRKPNWDSLAEFIYKDLCDSAELRQNVKDVQFHPVKMLLFVKFQEEKFRDDVVKRLQSLQGVYWTEYGVNVRGHSLDSQVKFIRLLGVSPETTEEDIKKSFLDVGIGEIVDLKKGLLDQRRLPGVTNGTWSLRVKIFDPDKIIPSYIHRRDEGELWSLNFEGRIFCCWKCGSSSHIGDKCRDQARTFEEIFTGDPENETQFTPPTWAAVVRSGSGETEVQKARREEIENKIKEDNRRRDREKRFMEEKKKAEEEEAEYQRMQAEQDRRKAIEDVEKKAKQLRELEREKQKKETEITNDTDQNSDAFEDDQFLDEVALATPAHIEVPGDEQLHLDLAAGSRAMQVAVQHNSWLRNRAGGLPRTETLNITVDRSLETVFGPGATLLAIEYEGNHPNPGEGLAESETEFSSDSCSGGNLGTGRSDNFVSSTPKKTKSGRIRKRKRGKGGLGEVGGVSPIRESENVGESSIVENSMCLGSSFITSESGELIETVQEGGNNSLEDRETDSEGNDEKLPRLDISESTEGGGNQEPGMGNSGGSRDHSSGVGQADKQEGVTPVGEGILSGIQKDTSAGDGNSTL